MKTRQLRPGDEIEANVKGRRFHAIVEDLDAKPCPFGKPVKVRPLSKRLITDTYLSARQIVRRVRRGPGQMELA